MPMEALQMPIPLAHSPDENVPRRGARWQDVVQRAQTDFAVVFASTLATGRLDRRGFRHWLTVESALSWTGALALERLADWHDADPDLRAAAQSWASDLREDAIAATADLHALGGGVALALPPAIASWYGYVTAACGSPRAGEALGTVLLHDALLRDAPGHDAAPPVSAGLRALESLAPCSHAWLGRRLRVQTPAIGAEREPLCAAWSSSALATGARRAWEWYRATLDATPGFGGA